MQNKTNIRSLKVRLITSMILILAIPLLILGINASSSSTNAMRESVLTHLDDLTKDTAELIHSQLDTTQIIIKSMATNGDIINVATDSDTTSKMKAQIVLENNIINSNGLIQSVYIANTQNTLMNDMELDIVVDISDRDYFNEALTGKSSTSDVILSKTTNLPVVVVAEPIYKGTSVVGVIFATVDFNVLTNKISQVKVFDGGYGYIIDRNGLVLYHPVEEHRMNLNLTSLNIPELNTMFNDIIENKSGQTHYTFEGVEKYARYEVVNGWGIVVTANYDDYMAAAHSIRNTTLAIGFIALLLASIFIYYFININVIKPIRYLNSLMSSAGNGDLTVRSDIESQDEFQTLSDQFNLMIEKQEEIVENVRMGSNQLSATSDVVSKSSMEVSSATQQIAASITEVAENTDRQNNDMVEASKIMLQFSTLIELAKKTAIEAEINMKKSMEAAETGRAFVKDNKEAMIEIKTNTEGTNKTLGELSVLSVQVSGIVKSINDIASQTNLLALNAAIESARAGVHGQGFAVVAEQVRQLSEQAAKEAQKINVVIEDMVSMIDVTVTSMNEGYEAVEKGVAISEQTDDAFVDILKEVQTTMEKVLHIVSVTEEEVASSEKILQVIDSVATLTEKNSLNAQSVAAGAEEQATVVTEVAENTVSLQKMATNLDELVNKFRTRGEVHV